MDKSKVNYYLIVVLFFLFLQILFWLKTENIKPDLSIVPEVPTLSIIKAFSLGDEQWGFRTKGLRIQNCGDTFGRFTPLRDYNYKKLAEWFKLLDELDYKSNYIPSMASYYFSATQNKNDLIYIINYLQEHSDKEPEKNWWWYYQAMSLAHNELKDKKLALKLATKLKEYSPVNAPIWTKQLLPIILDDVGEKCESLKVMISISEEYNKQNIGENELNYMQFFIKNKMEKLKIDKNFDIKKCVNVF